MAGEREALARLIAPASWRMPEIRGMWDAKQEIEDSLSAADRILAAGWRPLPEPQTGPDHEARERLEIELGAFLGGQPPEPQRRMVDGLPWPPEPQAAASEVEKAREWCRLYKDNEPKTIGAQVALRFARALLTEHARSETAEREREDSSHGG